MPDFKPTDEQLSIITAARETTANLALVARAGAAKTSTLVLIAEALPSTPILCLAFNKSIAEEMNERLPDNCEAKTLHSLGFAAWRQFISGRRTKIDSGKLNRLIYDLLDGDSLDREEKDEIRENLSDIRDTLRQAKIDGYLPVRLAGAKSLISADDFYLHLPVEHSDFVISFIDTILSKSFSLAIDGVLDFDDMIYCPALCPVSWPAPELTLIDEAQDLSPINHHILKKLVKNRRIIAVGDPCQAIYGFRGALEDSMDQLISRFDMETLYLTISFRCARLITENVHWRAPDMQSPSWAIDGHVERVERWDFDLIPDNSAVICRNNAPLFSLALRMIEADRLPQIEGRDLLGPLDKILRNLGPDGTPQPVALSALDDWMAARLKKVRKGAAAQVYDYHACLSIIISRSPDLGSARTYLKHLIERDGRVRLMTGHKSKGLEFDTVFFLDSHLCKIERGQDANVKYVIETRAKSALYYIDSEQLVQPEGAE